MDRRLCKNLLLIFFCLPASASFGQTWSKIIDDGQSGYSEEGQAWATWSVGGYNNGYRYLSHKNKGLKRVGKAHWQTKVPYTGFYEIEVHFRQTVNRTTDADYKWKDGKGKSYHRSLNQAKLPTGWHKLGRYYWSKGQVSKITLDGTDDNQSDEADAIRWTFVGAGTPPPPPTQCAQQKPGRYKLTVYAGKVTASGDWKTPSNGQGSPDNQWVSSPNVDRGEIVTASDFKFCTPPGKFNIAKVTIGVLSKVQYSSGVYKLILYLESAGKRFPFSQTSSQWATGDITMTKSAWTIADLTSLSLRVGLNSHPGGKRDSDAWIDAFRIEVEYVVPPETQPCANGQILCEGRCVSSSNNRSHCGSCRKSCSAGEDCKNGLCVTTCPTNQQSCNGQCVDLTNNNNHCGACGKLCPSGSLCSNNVCSKSCQAPAKNCADRCVDLQKDTAHCGSCSKGCGENEVCDSGKCSKSCPTGEARCGNACVQLSSDPAHCGGCGNKCKEKEGCSRGVCVPKSGCSEDELFCKGRCANINAELNNCGSCGRSCRTGQFCYKGMCYTTKGGEPIEPEPPTSDAGAPIRDASSGNQERAGSSIGGRKQGCLCSPFGNPSFPTMWLLLVLILLSWRKKKQK